MGWTRPHSITFPTTWRQFEGKKIIGGRKRQYWVQDITDEYRDVVVNYMVYGFSGEEPIYKCNKIITYPDVLKNAVHLFTEILKQKVGLVCLTKDRDGNIQIAGMNCTYVISKDDKIKVEPDEKLTKIFHTIHFMETKIDPYVQFHVKRYLGSKGIYVLPEFRRDRVCIELLKSREALCKAINMTLTCTVFTTRDVQTCAHRAGFKGLYAISYEDLAKIDPNCAYPAIEDQTDLIRFMYKEFEDV